MSNISDIIIVDRSVYEDENKRDDGVLTRNENVPSEVLYAAPTQVRVAAVVKNDRHDLSTLSETNEECGSESFTGESFTGACSTNIFQQIGQTFSAFFLGCNCPNKGNRADGNETTNTRTTTAEGSIDCPSPRSPTNPNNPTCMSMIARPSLSISSYQRGKMKVATCTNEESWDDAFRKASSASHSTSTKKHRPRKEKKKGSANSSHYATSKSTTASKKTLNESTSEPAFQGSTLTLSPTKCSRKDPPIPLQSPMSSLGRSSVASSFGASKSRHSTNKFIRQASVHVHQATPLYPLAIPIQVSCRHGLGVVTGKKTIVLLPGYLHNFELADDPTSFKAGPVVSWAPETHSHGYGAVSVGDHIVRVNGKDTRRMTALDVTRLLHTKRHRERVVSLSFWFHE